MATRREQVEGLRSTWDEITDPEQRQELVTTTCLLMLGGAVDIEIAAYVFDMAREAGLSAPDVYGYEHPILNLDAEVG